MKILKEHSVAHNIRVELAKNQDTNVKQSWPDTAPLSKNIPGIDVVI